MQGASSVDRVGSRLSPTWLSAIDSQQGSLQYVLGKRGMVWSTTRLHISLSSLPSTDVDTEAPTRFFECSIFCLPVPSVGVLDREMEHRWYRVDFNAIPQLQHEMGLDPCEGFTNWACYDDTAMYQYIMSTEPYTQSFNLNISTPAGTEQSSGSPALSSPSLCEAVPCQKERVRKPSLCYSLLRYSDFQS